MVRNDKSLKKLENLALELDDYLVDFVPNFVGTGIERCKSKSNKFMLCVHISDASVKNLIPSKFHGEPVHVRLVEQPRFANAI